MKHLLGIDELSVDEIQEYLDLGQFYAEALNGGQWDGQKLKNKVVMTLFFENSTRTVTSFNFAALRLGAELINWNAGVSSLNKNESFQDTIDTLGAMKPDAVVIRHSEYGAPIKVAERMECPVINAGDSYRAHPTQALLDALTIIQEKGSLEGLNVAICGDLSHSRVASSNAHLLTKMGVNLRFVAPDFFKPEKMPAEGIDFYDSLDEGIKDCDVVMMLRVQKERITDKEGLLDDASYFKQYGLNHERLKAAKSDVMVMHPGPMNRGIEISGELADDLKYSRMAKQVENGVYARMAVLDLLLYK